MSLPLIIWLPDELRQPWPWFQGDRNGTAITDADKLGLGALQNTPVQIILAGQSVRQIQHELPPMKEADKMAAARFAIENHIGGSISGQHIIIGTSQHDAVFVISHKKMKDVLDHLSRADIHPNEIYADFDCLSGDQPFFLDDRAIYTGATGYTLDRDWAKTDGPDDRLSQLMSAFKPNEATNLLTGEYANAPILPFNRKSLARVAALLAITFTAWLGFEWTQTRALDQQTQMLKSETSNLYSASTGKPAPPNPALTVTRAVKSGGKAQSNFLDLSRLLFSAIAQTDGVMIETLQYDRQKNQLSLRLIYPEFESAGTLENVLRKNGGLFRSGGVREQSGRLIGDAVLEVQP